MSKLKKKVLLDYKEFARLLQVEDSYVELMKEHKKLVDSKKEQQGTGNDSNDKKDQQGTGKYLPFRDPDEVISDEAPLTMEPPPLSGTVANEVKENGVLISLEHIRKQFRPRAAKLLARVQNVPKSEIEILPNLSVKINGQLIEHSHLSDLVASLYYPKRKAAGKMEWQRKLKSLNLLQNKSQQVETMLPKEWWYIGPI